MRSFVKAVVLLTLVNCPALIAQPALSVAKLDALKSGTVFIPAGGFQRSGSGFVVALRNDTVFAVTNAHVLASQTLQGSDSVDIILDAGTAKARPVSARIVCVDEPADLAIFSFQVEDPPQPLPFAQDADVPETTPVFVLGFPFGEALAKPNATPAVTISRAAVSARLLDKDGFVEKLQLDGEVNPGNSGGPIVNAKGEVLGVVVAKVSGTAITFGIPIFDVRENLRGRIRDIHFGKESGDQEFILIDVTVRLIDPLGRISGITIVTASKTEGKAIDLGKPGDFKKLPHGKEHELVIGGDKATGQVKLKKAAKSKQSELCQVELMRKGESNEYTDAVELPRREAVADDTGKASTPAAALEPPEDFGQPSEHLDAEKTVNLPAEVEDLAVAGGGRYLVMKLHDTPALTVFDTFKADGVKHIRLPSTEFLFAAGGNTAVVYLRGENLLQSYDLTTLERRKTKPNPFGPVITNLVMGHSRGGRALVRHSAGGNQHSSSPLSLLDTTRLEPVMIPEKDRRPAIPSFNGASDQRVHFRASRDMSWITEWATSHSPGGLGLLIRQGDSYEHRYEHTSDGALVAGDDGRVYTQTGKIYSNRLEQLATMQGMNLFPALGGVFYLAVSADGKIMLYEASKMKPLGPLGEFPDWKKGEGSPSRREDDLALDRRIMFDPVHGRIAFIPRSNTSIVLRPFDLKAALDASGVDYLIITSTPSASAAVKKKWSYQIEAISKAGEVTYSLELAPKGMKVTKSGLVTWTPKAPLAPNGEKIIVLMKDGSGEEAFHSFVIFPASE